VFPEREGLLAKAIASAIALIAHLSKSTCACGQDGQNIRIYKEPTPHAGNAFGIGRAVDQLSPFLLLSTGIFAGALVQSVSGFAFSAIAGAVLLHTLPPAEAVPLMMVCSVAVQVVSLAALKHRISITWHRSLMFIFGGVLGLPPALYLLHHVDLRTFRIGFGTFLAAYAIYMLLRPATACLLEDWSDEAEKRVWSLFEASRRAHTPGR